LQNRKNSIRIFLPIFPFALKFKKRYTGGMRLIPGKLYRITAPEIDFMDDGPHGTRGDKILFSAEKNTIIMFVEYQKELQSLRHLKYGESVFLVKGYRVICCSIDLDSFPEKFLEEA